ncbi:MAG: ABC transporter permease [Acidobacteriota bacterium]
MTIAADARYAVRTLAKSPGFAAAAIATLALAIGANTAIFSLVHSVLLSPLPYPASDRLASVHEADLERGIAEFSASPPNYFDWRDRNRSFSALAAYQTQQAALTGIPGRAAERISVTVCSKELLPVLGVEPMLGRVFSAEETTRGGPSAVVISHALWRKAFGSDPHAVGKVLRLDGVSSPVIGVMPAGFEYPAGESAAWLPLTFGEKVMTQRGAHYLDVIGRLKPGVSVEQASADIAAIHRQIHAENPGMNPGWTTSIQPLHDQISGKARPALWTLLGACAFVLLIACANVANLLLSRATARESELAIRAALGAGRGRIVRQLLTESLVLAAAGCGLGILLAGWAVSWIVRLGPKDLPRLSETRLDLPVLLFSVGLAAVTALLFGLAPALRTANRGVGTGLKSAGRSGGAERETAALRNGLVLAEIALSLVLLAGAGLLLRSFVKLENQDPGFHATSVLTYQLSLPQARYPDEESEGRFYESLLARTRTLPGVRSAAAIFGLPLTGVRFSSTFTIHGAPPATPDNEPSAQVRVVSRDYLRTIGLPVVAGRAFTADDRRRSPIVLLASATAARRYWPAGNAIGQRVRFGARPGTTRIEGEIVGVVGDVRDAGLDRVPTPFFYASLDQCPVDEVAVVIATSIPPDRLAKAATAAVAAIDPDIPVSDVRTMDEIVPRSIARQKFATLLLVFFAGSALLLASLGTYGVLAYSVGLRRREFGVRAALGAAPRAVLLLVVRQGAVLAAVGTAIGIAGALAGTRLLSALLFGVSARDALVLASAACVLIVVSLAASALPAWRASRVSPSDALRAD